MHESEVLHPLLSLGRIPVVVRKPTTNSGPLTIGPGVHVGQRRVAQRVTPTPATRTGSPPTAIPYQPTRSSRTRNALELLASRNAQLVLEGYGWPC